MPDLVQSHLYLRLTYRLWLTLLISLPGCHSENRNSAQVKPLAAPNTAGGAHGGSSPFADSRDGGSGEGEEVSAPTGTGTGFGLLPMIDEQGVPSRLHDFLGRPVIVFFGYASCNSVCPTSLGYLAQELEQLGDDRKRVVPLFISIDAKGDSTDKVRSFVKQFAPDIKGFTGSEESLRQLIAAFKPLGNYVPQSAPSANHSLDHFRSFILVDPQGQITGMMAPPYQRGALAKFIATHLEWYQAEQTTP